MVGLQELQIPPKKRKENQLQHYASNTKPNSEAKTNITQQQDSTDLQIDVASTKPSVGSTSKTPKQIDTTFFTPLRLIGTGVGGINAPLSGIGSYQILKQLHYEQPILGMLDRLNQFHPQAAQLTTALAVVTLIAAGAMIGFQISCKIELAVNYQENMRT